MKFTNIYTDIDAIYLASTAKAMLVAVETKIKGVGDVYLQCGLPNGAFNLYSKLKLNNGGDYEKEQRAKIGIQKIEEFEYKFFNKELNIEIKGDFNKVLEILRGEA